MNIINAVKSGKRFRRECWDKGLYINQLNDSSYSIKDVIADDWEIEEPTVTLTKTQFYHAVADVMELLAYKEKHLFLGPFGYTNRPYNVEGFSGWKELAEKLGL